MTDKACGHVYGFVDNGIECWLAYDDADQYDANWMNADDSWFQFCPDCGVQLRPSTIISELQETIDGLQEAGALPDNVEPILTEKTMGIDQLRGFDANGNPGPCVTLEDALAEVKRLSTGGATDE